MQSKTTLTKTTPLPLRKTMMAIAIFILLFSMLLKISAYNDPPPEGGEVDGNWVVTDTREYEDCTIIMNGNLIISSQGSLTFRNVTLLMNSTSDGEYTIEVRGEFYVYDKDNNPSTIFDRSKITAYDSNYEFNFLVSRGATFVMKNSELSESGYQEGNDGSAGLTIRTNNILIENNTIHNNYYGIFTSLSDNHQIKNNTIYDNNYGIYISSSNNNFIAYNNIYSNTNYGIYSDSSSNNNISYNKIQNSSLNIYLISSTLNTFYNNTISNAGSGFGIQLYSSSNDNTLRKNNISKTQYGIQVSSSDNTNIEENSAHDSDYGIVFDTTTGNYVSKNLIYSNKNNGLHLIDDASNNINNNKIYLNNGDGIASMYSSENSITENEIYLNSFNGISMNYTDNITIDDNTIYDNGEGISLHYSENSSISNNILKNNSEINLHIFGSEKQHYQHDILASNSVNGKPIYYYFNLKNQVFQNLNAGYIAIAFSDKITIKDADVVNGNGISVQYTNNSTIINSNLYNNTEGIYLYFSSENKINGNEINSNKKYGIYIYNYENNTINENKIYLNKEGIFLQNTANTTITNNDINSSENNSILLYSSLNSIIKNNKINNSFYGIALNHTSNDNAIIENNITNTNYGVYLASSSNTLIENATIYSSEYDLYLKEETTEGGSKNTVSINTTFNEDKVFVSSKSKLIVKNYLEVFVQDIDKNPISNATISIKDNGKEIYKIKNANYSWIEISANGTEIGTGDDNYYNNRPIGFTFNFYGNNYSNFHVSTNGFISFTTLSDAYSINTEIMNTNAPNNLIAVFWDDLDVRNGIGNIYYKTYGSSPNRYTVIEWYNVDRKNSGEHSQADFEIILYENGNIKIQYKDVDFENANYNFGKSATIGVENSDASIGTEYSNNKESLRNNFAIILEKKISTDENGLISWIPVIYKIYSGSSTPNIHTTKIEVSYFGLGFIDNPRDINMSSFRRENFTAESVKLNSYAVEGVDLGGGSKYEYLSITFWFNITNRGNYKLVGKLYDENKNLLIATAENTSSLSTGNKSISLNISGDDIYNAGINSPYTLNWTLYKEGWIKVGNGDLNLTNYDYTSFNQIPKVAITSPSNNTVVKGNIQIYGTSSDEITVQEVQIKIDNGSWQLATDTDNWYYNWDSTLFSEGNHTVYVRSYDGILYSNISQITLFVDNIDEPPTIAITSPSNNTEVSGTITIRGNANDAEGNIQKVEIKIDDGNWIQASGKNSWSYDWDTTTVSDGQHSIYARSFDGNNYSSIAYITLNVDNINILPIVSISSPINNSTVKGTISVQGDAEDEDDTIQKVEIKIDDGNWIQVSGTNSWSYDWDTTTVSDGQHSIYARSYDGRGYSNESYITVLIDNFNEVPTAYIDTISPNPAEEGQKITFKGHGTDDDGTIEEYEWYSDIDGTIGNYAELERIMSIGEHTIKFRVKDNNDTWSGYAIRTLTVNEKEKDPIAVFVSYSELKTNSIKLTWTKNNNSDFKNYTVYISQNNQSWNFLTSISSINTTYYEITNLNSNTTYYFKVRVYDIADLFNDSNIISVRTLSPKKPSSVSLSPTQITFNSITLTWSKSNENNFARYEIYKSTKEGNIGILLKTINNKDTTSYTAEDLTSDTTYYFTIRVYNTDGLYSDDTITVKTLTEKVEEEAKKQDFTILYVGVGVVLAVIILGIFVRKKKMKPKTEVQTEKSKMKEEKIEEKQIQKTMKMDNGIRRIKCPKCQKEIETAEKEFNCPNCNIRLKIG